MIDPREERLPKWARDLLATERRERKNAEELAAAQRLASPLDESDALLDRYGNTVGLGRDPQVSYRVPFPGFSPDSGFITVRQLGGDYPGLYVHATAEIVTRNRAINAIEIVPWPGQ